MGFSHVANFSSMDRKHNNFADDTQSIIIKENLEQALETLKKKLTT